MSDPSTPVGGEPASPYRAHAEALLKELGLPLFHWQDEAPEALAAIEAALLAAREQGGWQSMESAPKNADVVLLGYLGGEEPPRRLRACVSRWYALRGDSPIYLEGWAFSAPGYADRFAPIAWMPLPAPPETGKDTP